MNIIFETATNRKCYATLGGDDIEGLVMCKDGCHCKQKMLAGLSGHMTHSGTIFPQAVVQLPDIG